MKMLVGLMMAVTGCTTMPADGPMPPEQGAGACNADAAQDLVGRPATSQLAADAQRRSGAATVRWLRPGQVVTMEFRADRLNITVDAGNRVESIRCG